MTVKTENKIETALKRPTLRIAPRKAILYMVAAVSSLAILDAGVKALAEAYPVPEIAFLRYIVGLVFAVGLAMRSSDGIGSLGTRRPVGHLIHSFSNLGAMLLFYYAIARMALADVVSIAFAAPIFTTTLSVLLLKEKVSARRWAAVAIGFAGVLVMVQPGGGVWASAQRWRWPRLCSTRSRSSRRASSA